MNTATTATAPQAPSAPHLAVVPPWQGGGVDARPPRSAVNRPGTPERVRCAGHAGYECPTMIRRNKSGRCRACWLAAKSEAPNYRKTDPAEQIAMLTRMVRSTARRAINEDPGVALAGLLALEDEVRALVRGVGQELVSQVGQTNVAVDLTVSTGQPWTRQRVNKRWGGQS